MHGAAKLRDGEKSLLDNAMIYGLMVI
jgi:hypothetical protein